MNRDMPAGLTAGAGGVAIMLSAFLPWVSAVGVVQGRPASGTILLLLALGGALTFLSSQLLLNRAAAGVRVALRILAVVDILVSFVFVLCLTVLRGNVVLGFLVRPAIGFYLALAGLIASIVGTFMVSAKVTAPSGQSVVASSTPAVQFSPDGNFWWDGATWRPTGNAGAQAQRAR